MPRIYVARKAPILKTEEVERSRQLRGMVPTTRQLAAIGCPTIHSPQQEKLSAFDVNSTLTAVNVY